MRTNHLSSPVTRRGFLRLAAGGGFAGFSSASWLSAWPPTPRRRGGSTSRASSCSCAAVPATATPSIPSRTRARNTAGPFKAIQTAVPGIQVSEMFPRVAEQMKHAAILRGMSHNDAGHAGGTYLMHTGFPLNEPKVDGKPYPGLGAVVSKADR